jgi:hypothetical protein
MSTEVAVPREVIQFMWESIICGCSKKLSALTTNVCRVGDTPGRALRFTPVAFVFAAGCPQDRPIVGGLSVWL